MYYFIYYFHLITATLVPIFTLQAMYLVHPLLMTQAWQQH
jgi:hypothetical protein